MPTAISTPARRWAAGSRSLFRPIFFIFVFTAPGSYFSFLPSLVFRPRGAVLASVGQETGALPGVPSVPYPKPKARRETKPLPSTFYSLYLLQNPARNAPSAWHKFNPNVARRWHVARAVPSALPPDEKRSPPPLERGLPRGAEPLSDVERGSRGNHS